MIKTSFTNLFNWNEPPVQLVPVSRRGADKGFFSKQASDFLEANRKLVSPPDGHTPVFIFAMGSMEKIGANRNADAWPGCASTIQIYSPKDEEHKVANISAGLKEKAYTFEKHAKIYKDHKNSDPSLAKGEIHRAFYNEPMGRVEVIAYLKNAEWEDELEDLANGKPVPFSMSARVPYDQDSYCGNKAKSRAQYCVHLEKHAGAVLDNGHQVVAINEDPTFIDLSGVRRNADRIGYGLAKVAADETIVKPGALLAEELGKTCPESVLMKVAGTELRHKVDLLRKLSTIEKEIEGEAKPVKELAKAVDPSSREPITRRQIIILRSHKPSLVFKGLSDAGVILPPRGLFDMLLGDSTPGKTSLLDEVEDCVPGIFSTIRKEDDLETFLSAGHYEPEEKAVLPPDLEQVINELVPSYSVKAGPVRRRIIISVIEPKEARVRIRKSASERLSSKGKFLAKEYARYVVSSLRKAGNDELYLSILANYIN